MMQIKFGEHYCSACREFTLVIISGTHTGEPIGHLSGPNNEIVSVWSTNPGDLLEAMTQAIGPVPSLPSFGLGGSVEIITPLDPLSKDPPQVIYNPAGDVVNQVIAQAYVAQITAWNARAQTIQAAVQEIIKNRTTSKQKISWQFVRTPRI